jgi:cell division inhibitor SepF
MANGFLKRGMSYLGLIDDGFDEGGEAIPDDHLDSPPLTAHELSNEDGLVPTTSVQPVDPAEGERSSNVTLITPRVVRARFTELSPHVQAVAPTEFADARQIADNVMASQPVIVNLQTASRELKRRMIDFCSGVTYALDGGMERVAKSVFLITPSDVELSAVERERALLGPDSEFSAIPDAQAL